jgi:hypothetical protein
MEEIGMGNPIMEDRGLDDRLGPVVADELIEWHG